MHFRNLTLSVLSLFVTILGFDARACLPGEQKSTSVGAVFTCENRPASWGASWRDPSGVIWSSSQGLFENRGPNEGSQISDSPAVRACQTIGGHLPPKEEYFRFRHYFALTPDGLFLSEQGRRDLHSIFPDMKDSYFWTSSVLDFNILHAYFFHGDLGTTGIGGHTGLRDRPHSVRCIGN